MERYSAGPAAKSHGGPAKVRKGLKGKEIAASGRVTD